jgi:hypothetical protein
MAFRNSLVPEVVLSGFTTQVIRVLQSGTETDDKPLAERVRPESPEK